MYCVHQKATQKTKKKASTTKRAIVKNKSRAKNAKVSRCALVGGCKHCHFVMCATEYKG